MSIATAPAQRLATHDAANAAPSRRVMAHTLAQHAATTITAPTAFRRLLVSPEETLDWLCSAGTADPGPTLMNWSLSPLLATPSKARNLRDLREIWGQEQMLMLALASSTLAMYQPEVTLISYRRSQLIRHQLCVGWAARLIAIHCSLPQDQALLAGVLHDVGFLAMERLARSPFSQVLMNLDRMTPTVAIERELIACDHAQVGAELLRAWGVDETICEAVQWHHVPLGAPLLSRRLTCAVALANYLASRFGKTSLGVHNVAPLCDEVFALLRLEYRELSAIVDQFHRILPEIEQLAAL